MQYLRHLLLLTCTYTPAATASTPVADKPHHEVLHDIATQKGASDPFLLFSMVDMNMDAHPCCILGHYSSWPSSKSCTLSLSRFLANKNNYAYNAVTYLDAQATQELVQQYQEGNLEAYHVDGFSFEDPLFTHLAKHNVLLRPWDNPLWRVQLLEVVDNIGNITPPLLYCLPLLKRKHELAQLQAQVAIGNVPTIILPYDTLSIVMTYIAPGPLPTPKHLPLLELLIEGLEGSICSLAKDYDKCGRALRSWSEQKAFHYKTSAAMECIEAGCEKRLALLRDKVVDFLPKEESAYNFFDEMIRSRGGGSYVGDARKILFSLLWKTLPEVVLQAMIYHHVKKRSSCHYLSRKCIEGNSFLQQAILEYRTPLLRSLLQLNKELRLSKDHCCDIDHCFYNGSVTPGTTPLCKLLSMVYEDLQTKGKPHPQAAAVIELLLDHGANPTKKTGIVIVHYC